MQLKINICKCTDKTISRPLSVPFLFRTSGKGTDMATPLGTEKIWENPFFTEKMECHHSKSTLRNIPIGANSPPTQPSPHCPSPLPPSSTSPPPLFIPPFFNPLLQSPQLGLMPAASWVMCVGNYCSFLGLSLSPVWYDLGNTWIGGIKIFYGELTAKSAVVDNVGPTNIFTWGQWSLSVHLSRW